MNSILNKWKLAQHLDCKFIYKACTILITTFSIIIVDYFNVPNPAIICLIGVVFSAFVGGYLYGVISGILTLIYCMYFFSYENSFLFYNSENIYKIVVILVALITMVFMVGTLKKTVENRTNELLMANEKLMKLSTIDELTGLFNYRYFISTIESEWMKSSRSKTCLSIAMIDIDYFKKYNDYYGHQIGNECLKRIAEIIVSQLDRPATFAARYGGEEYVVVMPDTNANDALKVMEKIREAIEDSKVEHRIAEPYHYITVSIGFATIIPEKDSSYEILLRQADYALYDAKQKGKNIVSKYGNQHKIDN